MKKFEIINNQWIKQQDLATDLTGKLSAAIKISDVAFITSQYDSNRTSITLWICTSSGNLPFIYYKTEFDQYKEDLALLEKLLIQ